ncbi:Hypothetical predicted protein [Olea europaea subsp. europaea]|uniref:Uncharacterized protein n=1 Tax=Olea europaea subsp. europaea TaxID=158383 RepID=A0A8S0SAP7_OLEEU|nr:Hypothetical predicted protein [Olea europaea subsp. europaea]
MDVAQAASVNERIGEKENLAGTDIDSVVDRWSIEGVIRRLCVTSMNEEVKATEMMEVIDRMGDSTFVNEGVICTALMDCTNQLESTSHNKFSDDRHSSFVIDRRSEEREGTKKKIEMREW